MVLFRSTHEELSGTMVLFRSTHDEFFRSTHEELSVMWELGGELGAGVGVPGVELMPGTRYGTRTGITMWEGAGGDPDEEEAEEVARVPFLAGGAAARMSATEGTTGVGAGTAAANSPPDGVAVARLAAAGTTGEILSSKLPALVAGGTNSSAEEGSMLAMIRSTADFHFLGRYSGSSKSVSMTGIFTKI